MRAAWRLVARAFQGGLMMGLAEGGGVDVVVLEEAIGTLGGGTRPAGLGQRRGGLLGEGGGDHEQTLRAAGVAELSAAKLGDGPVGGWNRRGTKRRCSGFKHPVIEVLR